MKTKYIVFNIDGVESIFTFPAYVNHDDMADSCRNIKTYEGLNWKRKHNRDAVVSAGFVINGKCQGRSETLDIKSREQIDTKLLGLT